MLTPVKRYMDDALDAMLPFYGITSKAERREAIKNGVLHQVARMMSDLAWSTLGDKMEAYDECGMSRKPLR